MERLAAGQRPVFFGEHGVDVLRLIRRHCATTARPQKRRDDEVFNVRSGQETSSTKLSAARSSRSLATTPSLKYAPARNLGDRVSALASTRRGA